MAETHDTEKIGLEILKKYLITNNRIVTKSDLKQFDLVVDGQYCELKTKRKAFSNFDFFYVSENQMSGIKSGQMVSLFLVCNIDNPEIAEIYEIPSNILSAIEPKTEIKYYYDKVK